MRHGEYSPCLAPTIYSRKFGKDHRWAKNRPDRSGYAAIAMPLKHRTGTAICLTFDLHAIRASEPLDRFCRAYWIVKARLFPSQEYVLHTFIAGELIAEVAVQVISTFWYVSVRAILSASFPRAFRPYRMNSNYLSKKVRLTKSY